MLRRPPLPPEQVLALRAALLPGARGEDAFAEWRELVDFEATGSPAYRLLPLIYKNLGAGADSDPVLGRMRGVYRRTWVLNQIQLQGGERAIALLDELRIPTMLLKGAAMIARWTGDAGVRMMADFDLLVPREHALRAVEILRGAGWSPAVDRSGPLTETDLEEEHAILLRHEGGGELDLHWRALIHGAGRASDEALWERAEEIRLGEVSTRVPAPEDHVHHACSHATTWTAAGRVDWIADSGLIIREVGRGFDWSRVMELARLDRSEVVVRSLTAALSEVLEEPVPVAGTQRRLRIARPAIAERIEISLRGRMPHELGPAAELFLDLQSHRRRRADRLRRPLIASVPSFARERWRVEGIPGLVAQAAYAGLGRPPWLRRALVRRVRTRRVVAGELAGIDAASLDLRTEGAVRGSLVNGWSFAESEGRWTDGAEATLALRTSPRAGDLAIDVTALPLLHPEHPALDVEVWANDRPVGVWGYRLDQEAPASRRLVLPQDSLARSDVLEIAFVLRDPCRPMELGLSEDPRRLGLFVRELRFSHA
ncbi:MAG TPA: nucleotidyltransferase family protein [Solirubrobacterales bacterium]|jgi:hypothetical protein